MNAQAEAFLLIKSEENKKAKVRNGFLPEIN